MRNLIGSFFRPKTPYSVEFDREVAWSLAYCDSEGTMRFVFEPGDDPKRVHLGKRPLVDGKIPGEDFLVTERCKMAVERTKQYLVSCGYEVLLDD